MPRMVHHRKKAYSRGQWKYRRTACFNSRRGLYKMDKFLLLDLQSTASLSFDGACFALDWIHDSLTQQSKWNPLLEPLLEQLRRDTDLLLRYRSQLIDTFLMAGISGARFCWLELRCNISTMALSEIKAGANPKTQRLWRIYYDSGVADGWFIES